MANTASTVTSTVITDCYNAGEIHGYNAMGGIIGSMNNVTIYNSYNIGKLYAIAYAYWDGSKNPIVSNTTAGAFSNGTYGWSTTINTFFGEIGGYASQANNTIVNTYYESGLIYGTSGATYVSIPVGTAGVNGTSPYGVSINPGYNGALPAVFYINNVSTLNKNAIISKFNTSANSAWTVDGRFNNGYPTFRWVVGEAVRFVNNKSITTHTLTSASLAQGKSVTTTALSATTAGVSTSVSISKFNPIGDTITLENGKVYLPANVFQFNGVVYVPKNTKLDYKLIPDEGYVIDKSASRDYYGSASSKNLFSFGTHEDYTWAISGDHGHITITNNMFMMQSDGSGGPGILHNRKYAYTTGDTYTLSRGASSTGNRFLLRINDADGNLIDGTSIAISGWTWNKYYKAYFGDLSGTSKSFTISDSSVKSFQVGFAINSAQYTYQTWTDVQLELSETASGYKPEWAVGDSRNDNNQNLSEMSDADRNTYLGTFTDMEQDAVENVWDNNAVVVTNKSDTGFTINKYAVHTIGQEWISANLIPNTIYTLSMKYKIISNPTTDTDTSGKSRTMGIYLYKSGATSVWMYLENATTNKTVGDIVEVKRTFKTPTELSGYQILSYAPACYNSAGSSVGYSEIQYYDIMLLEGDYSNTEVPEYTPYDGSNYHVTVDSSKDIYVNFQNDVFDVTINSTFAVANGVTLNTSGNEYLNYVIYNKDNNKAYFDSVVANSTTQSTVFEGINGGEYVIGIYEGMFYEIKGDGDVSYKVGTGSSVSLESDANANYVIILDNSKAGIIITVVVTKQYDSWLYNIKNV